MKFTSLFRFVFAFTFIDLSVSLIISSYILPHGGIALDPSYFNTTNQTAKTEAFELNNACKYVGQHIASLSPDLIFLSTPHGVADLKNFAFYLNPTGSGQADTDNCQCPPCCYSVNATLDCEIAADIIQVVGKGRNITGFSGYGPKCQSDEPFPLKWGEVIPLYFIPNLNNTKIVVLSQPTRRYTDDVPMIPELLDLGKSLFHYLDKLSNRVVVIISADLAHTHDPKGPYGFSKAAEPFDLACGKWAGTLNAEYLLTTASQYVDKALSCGYTGLVMLHGMLTEAGLSKWTPKLNANYHPSYYGMMVASIQRNLHQPSLSDL